MNMQVTEQAPTPSVEERAGKAFSRFMGFEEKKPQANRPQEQPQNLAPEQAETDQTDQTEQVEQTEQTEAAPDGQQAETAEEFFEFEMGGQKYQLPKSLEPAIMREKDYTQKTQSLAEQRKTAEHTMKRMQVDSMRSQFDTQHAAELQQLAALDSVLATASQSVNWAAMSTDEILRQKIQIDQYKEQREAIARSINGKWQQFEAAREQAISDLKSKAKELTTQRIPGWSEAVQKAVREHALTEGYTEAELAQAELDPRHNVTLWKAQQFDALKAQAKKTVTQVKSVKTTSSNPMPQAVKEKLAFSKAIQKTAPGSPEQKRLVEQRVGSLFTKR